MRLCLELPTAHLEYFSRLTDLDFCLAQVALEDADYAAFFKKQALAGRMVIMDNGFHETGHPLSIPELEQAVELVTPSVVISPDWLGKPVETYNAFEAFSRRMRNYPSTKVAVVMQGHSYMERMQFFHSVRLRCAMICLPFRADRRQWFKEMIDAQSYTKDHWPAYLHLLGMNEFEELHWFKKAVLHYGFPHFAVSIDTAKPVKWGLQNELLWYDKSPRGAKITNGELHRIKDISLETREIIVNNIAYLRRWV